MQQPEPEADLNFLKKLDARLWVVHNEGERGSSRGIGQYYLEKDKELLTVDDWRKIKKLIQRHSLICVPGAGPFGFGRSLALYKQPPDAPYPGTEKAFKPEYLLSFSNKHMEPVLGSKSDYNEWWKEMESLVYNDQNKALVKAHMPKSHQLQDKSYYEY